MRATISIDTITCPPDKLRVYNNNIEKGKSFVKNKRCVIAGLVRNASSALHYAIPKVEILGDLFDDYQVVIYENDSSDNTPDILNNWASRNTRVRVLSELRNDPVNRSIRCLRRTERMALYRQKVQTHVVDFFPSYNHVLLYDFDLGAGFQIGGILNSFGQSCAWDAMASNSLCYRNGWCYYDVWALRWANSYKPLWSRDVTPLRWRVGDDPFQVHSAFGGLCLYKMSAFRSGVYSGEDCEHIPFHKSMRNAGFGGLFLNPSQVTFYS